MKDVSTKIASIGQVVMQATRPRVILTPLQLGLGVQLHHRFASRFLIDTLHHVRTRDGSDHNCNSQKQEHQPNSQNESYTQG